MMTYCAIRRSAGKAEAMGKLFISSLSSLFFGLHRWQLVSFSTVQCFETHIASVESANWVETTNCLDNDPNRGFLRRRAAHDITRWNLAPPGSLGSPAKLTVSVPWGSHRARGNLVWRLVLWGRIRTESKKRRWNQLRETEMETGGRRKEKRMKKTAYALPCPTHLALPPPNLRPLTPTPKRASREPGETAHPLPPSWKSHDVSCFAFCSVQIQGEGS